MTEVRLVRRWGANEAGKTVDVDDEQARWLVGLSFGEYPDAPGTASAGARAPGEHGADPRAGGDISRGGGMRTRKGSRDDGKKNPETGEANYANRAAPAPGSPRPGGPNDPEAGGKASDDQGEGSDDTSLPGRHASGKSPVGPTPEQKQPAAGKGDKPQDKK